MTGFVPGGPGPRTPRGFNHGVVCWGGWADFAPGGGKIDVAKTRDITNVAQPLLLNPGLLMGVVTASSRWANSFIGQTQAAYVAGGATITLTPAQAAELVRRIGAAGNLTLIGPPAASGVVAVVVVAYTAVNQGTGAVTIANPGVNFIAGSLVADTDGSAVPKSFIFDGPGLTMAISTVNLPSYAEWPDVPVAAKVYYRKLLPAPTDPSLAAWVMSQLSTYSGGKFTFDRAFGQ